MTFPGYSVVLAITLLLWSSSAEATPQPSSSETDSAKKLFQAGKFAEANEVYAGIVARNPQDYSAILQLGRIALLSNRLTDAQELLQKALTLKPDDTDAKVMLAEAFYREDKFEKAGDFLSGIDVSSNQLIISQYPTLNTAKIASFKGQTPYEIVGEGESTRLKFVKSDVLPVVTVRINGGEEVTFFIDTGGSEVALDTDFAKELGVQLFGGVQGTFSGGQRTEVQNGRTDSITLGDWTVKNLPVVVLPLPWSRCGRSAYDYPVRCQASVIRWRRGEQCSRSLRWSFPLGRKFRFSSRRDGRSRFLQSLFSDP